VPRASCFVFGFDQAKVGQKRALQVELSAT